MKFIWEEFDIKVTKKLRREGCSYAYMIGYGNDLPEDKKYFIFCLDLGHITSILADSRELAEFITKWNFKPEEQA